MTRPELIRSLRKWILPKRPVQLKLGDCWDISGNSIDDQINNAPDGKWKVFYLEYKTMAQFGDMITISLESYPVFISKEDSVTELQDKKDIWEKLSKSI